MFQAAKSRIFIIVPGPGTPGIQCQRIGGSVCWGPFGDGSSQPWGYP